MKNTQQNGYLGKLRQGSLRVPALLVVIMLVTATFLHAGHAFAATNMTHVSVLETNMNTSGSSALIVDFTAGGADNSSTIAIAMGSAVTSVASAPAVSTSYNSVSCTSATLTGATNALGGTLSSSGNTGTTINVTIASGSALTAGQSYCFVVGSFAAQTAVVNTATAGSNPVTITDGSDTGSAAVDAVSGSDQVGVTAVVPPSFTMSILNPTDNFTANLAYNLIGHTSGDQITVNTNASHGWNIWASDATSSLLSTVAGASIGATTPGTNATLTAGTPGYLTGIPTANITQGTGGGTTSVTAAWTSSGSGNGSGFTTTPKLLATSSGTAVNASISPVEYAAISAATPAAPDYKDTITYIGSGTF